jgi:hypothetical protein
VRQDYASLMAPDATEESPKQWPDHEEGGDSLLRREEGKENTLLGGEKLAEEYSFDDSTGRLVGEAVPRRRALGLFGGALLGASGLAFLVADPAEARKRRRGKKRRRRAPVVAAGVTVSPTVLDFGEVNLGQPQVLPVTITNNGTTPVTVPVDGIVGDGFTLVDPGGGLIPITAPITIAPGETKVVDVAFAPVTLGLTPGAIEIVDGNDDIVEVVPVIGVGVV